MTAQQPASASAASSQKVRTHAIEVRVRYAECDPMNIVHHSVYPVWMELARTELLRAQGAAYRDLEAAGTFFVVARMSLRYRKPAKYDDLLTVEVQALPSAGVKIEHRYRILRDDELLVTAETTLVCLDREGKLQPVPAAL